MPDFKILLSQKGTSSNKRTRTINCKARTITGSKERSATKVRQYDHLSVVQISSRFERSNDQSLNQRNLGAQAHRDHESDHQSLCHRSKERTYIIHYELEQRPDERAYCDHIPQHSVWCR